MLPIHLLTLCYVYVLFAIDLPTNFTLANLVEVVNLQEQATQSDSVKCGCCVETGSSGHHFVIIVRNFSV